MSFFRGLKGVERFLKTVADQIGATDYAVPPNIQNPALLRTLPSIPTNAQLGGAGTAEGQIDPLSHILTPPTCVSEAEYMTYYSDLLDSSSAELAENIIPPIPNNMRQELATAIRQEMNAQILVQEAQAAVEANADENAKEHLANMQFLLQQSEEAALDIGSQVLNAVDTHMDHMNMNQRNHGNNNHWQLSVLQCTILTTATPAQLASYAVLGHDQAAQVHNLLHNPVFMNSILSSDGPKQQNYASMLRIYHELLAVSDRAKRGASPNDIFHRLALAVALEFAAPMNVFDTPDVQINPIERYRHYESAHVHGELDYCFATLTVWELRMVVNNDASNDEIQWCRDMLRNYRPDHILDRNEQWKYCMIVKSDVRYKRPEWAPNCPRTYKQMISGGGMCGPRAWFGRFACKSFGIPTWGVRQPGHAAMSHWTSSGEWVICLGGPNWRKSYWDNDRNGVDFEVETKARMSGDAYEKVLWLDCFANVNQEAKVGSQHRNYYKRSIEQRFWSELSLLQKKLLATCTSHGQARTRRVKNVDQVSTLVERILQSGSVEESCSQDYNGRINVPAAACCRPNRSCGKVIFMKSFLQGADGGGGAGGQIHLREDGSLEYQVNADRTGTYLLHARVVTVHADPRPLQLTLTNGGSAKHQEIEVPYTGGSWAETRPIQVELTEGQNALRFYRTEGLGLTIKEFILTPV